MFKYLLKRMALAILTLFIILFTSYILIAAYIPNPYFDQWANTPVSDPYKKTLGALKGAWDNGSVGSKFKDYFVTFFRSFHIPPQKGDFGMIIDSKLSSKYEGTMQYLFFKPLKYSVMVSLPAFVVSCILGICLGVFAGYKRGTAWDTIINIFVFFFIAIPSFIMAPIILNLFAKWGFERQFIDKDETGGDLSRMISSLIPPIVTITLGSLAVYTLYTRNQVVTVLTSNYVLIAKTKGLNGHQIFWKYVFRNISVPLSAIILPSYIGLLTGSIIIEKFWNIPGNSYTIINSFPKGEINIIMFDIFFFTSLSLGTEVLVDISYALIDPRIKYESNSGFNIFVWIKASNARKKEAKEYFNKLAQSQAN